MRLIPLAAAALLAASLPSWAAAPELCRPYATNLTQTLINRAWIKAYATCLNRDEVPEAPGSWQSAVGTAFPEFTPPGEVPASGPVSTKDDAHVCGRKSPASGASGSEERRRWCDRNYGSFDPKSGRVNCGGKKGKQPCA